MNNYFNDDEILLNPIYLDTEKNELNNIESKTPIRNKKNLVKLSWK